MTFSSTELIGAYPHGMCKEGRDFGGAWTDIDIFHLRCERKKALTDSLFRSLNVPPWHISHLLASGRIVYLLQDGWVTLWDEEHGLTRVKYLPFMYRWSISANCTAVKEIGGVIRVAVHSLSMGLFWFDFHPEEIYDCMCDSKCRLTSSDDRMSGPLSNSVGMTTLYHHSGRFYGQHSLASR
jgi:hypothetical protein